MAAKTRKRPLSPSSTKHGSVSASPADRLVTLPAGIPEDYGYRTLGYEAWQWGRKLTQPNGPRAGRTFRFTDEQLRFLLWWYALDDDARWLFDHGARRLAKGTGKSPFAAVWSLIEFCAPVRIERFDDRVHLGGCVGRPMMMPLVQIAATAESQTINTMRMVRAFAPKGSPVVVEHHLEPGKLRYYKQPEGTLEVITSSATAAEGAEATAIVGDETENWRPENGGVDLAATLEDNLAKSGARMIETNNAWVPGLATVAEATWDAWVAQEEGRTRGDGKILYDARLAPPDTDLTDPASLKAALEHIYADCDWKKPHDVNGNPDRDAPPDVRPIMDRIWSPKARPSESKRKYLNWPTTASDAWTDPRQFALLFDHRPVDDGEEVVLFFDGSKSKDATALIGCTVEDGHMFTVDVWEPDPANPEDVVPVVDVDLAVAQTFDRLRVVGFFGDVQEWESFVKVSWRETYADQLEVWAVPSGKDPQPIAWDMRGHVFEFTRECELVEAEINDVAFSHDGDPRLARHVGNARRRPNRWGVSIGKETRDSPRKIDAAVCLIGARMVRRLVLAERAKHPASKKAGRLVGWG